MFGMGGSELFLIILVFLLFFGANKIPEMARGLGKGMRQFRDAASGIQDEIEKGAKEVKDQADITRELKD
jgi:sec-independent protein translocase protein TatA